MKRLQGTLAQGGHMVSVQVHFSGLHCVSVGSLSLVRCRGHWQVLIVNNMMYYKILAPLFIL